MRTTVILCILAVAMGVALSTTAAAYDDEEAKQRARPLFDAARAAMAHGDHDQCVAKALEAWAIHEHVQIAAIVADCRSRSGDHVEAARFATRALALADTDPKTPEGVPPRMNEVLSESAKHIAMVTMSVSPEGARLTIDGEPAQLIEGRAFLLPGTYTFGAEAEGHEPAETERTLTAGATTIDFALLPASTSVPDPITPPRPDRASPSAVAFGAVLGVGIVGIIAGGAMMGAGTSFGDDGDTLLSEIVARSEAGSCPGGDPDCGRLRDMVEKKDTYWNAGLGVLVGGGVLTALGAIGLGVVLSGDDESNESTARILRFTPLLAPDQLGAGIHGRF